MCDVVLYLPRVSKSYHCRSKFGSVLHTENDDVSYGFSAIGVELKTLAKIVFLCCK